MIRQTSNVTGRILLVEDEDAIRRLIDRILSAAGYHVIQARDGREALDRIEDSDIDLLVTDIVMPELSGIGLVDELKGRGHDVKTLYMSGLPDPIVEEHGLKIDEQTYIHKPFTPEEIILKVQELIAAA